MTRLLAIETSSHACSVALEIDGNIIERYEETPRLHGQKLLPMIDAILAQASCALSSLDAIAFARGPGSFTGIRIATSVAQGLAFGADLPLLPVSTLAALAQTVFRQYRYEQIISVLDARMNEVYWGCYRVVNGCAEPQENEQMTQPHMVSPKMLSPQKAGGQAGCVGVGDGWGAKIAIPETLRHQMKQIYCPCYPHAQDVLRLALRDQARGLAVTPEQAQPAYMRDQTAWRKSPKFAKS